jgi:RNA polymerase sigma-70 factor (ECF subfamily)
VYLATDADDLVVVRQCLAGDRNAFQPIVERYHRVLFNVAFRILGNREEASDATQDAFVKVYQTLPRFDQNRRFYSWIYRILVNECLNVKRARRHIEPLGDDLVAPGSVAATLESAERRRQVHAAILSLSVEYRTVIALRHFAGMSYEDMSAVLDVPVKTVRSRLYTARQRLAAHLQEGHVGV